MGNLFSKNMWSTLAVTLLASAQIIEMPLTVKETMGPSRTDMFLEAPDRRLKRSHGFSVSI